MTEREKMLHAKSYIDMLAEGRNPLTGDDLQRDTTLNDARIVRCLFYVSELIERLAVACDDDGHLLSGGKSKRVRAVKQELNIVPEALMAVPLSETPLPISVFCKRVAETLNPEQPPALPATKITAWLEQAGYLQKIEKQGIGNGKTEKIPTEMGKRVGISSVDTIFPNGRPGRKNVYGKDAQRLILSHLPEIFSSHQ